MIGTIVGKYRVADQLGRGATGIVYKAIDETLDREVAIKALNPDLADSDIISWRYFVTVFIGVTAGSCLLVADVIETETKRRSVFASTRH